MRALCVISAGFAEIGEPRAASARSELLALVRAHGARLVGPNCLGIAVSGPSPERDLRAARAPAGTDRLLLAERRARPRAAREGVRARPRLLGVRLDRQQGRRLLERPARVLGGRSGARSSSLLYLESFGNPRRFARIARPRRAEEADPRDEERHATARARGPPARTPPRSPARTQAVDALFHQAGVLRARTLEELIDAAALLSTQPLPRGRRVAVLTNAGGLGILCADACEAAGLELLRARAGDDARRSRSCCPPRRASPTRSTCSARRPPRRYEAALPLVLADPAVDARDRALRPAGRRRAPRTSPRRSRGRSRRSSTDKPVLASLLSAEGVPRRSARRRRRPRSSRIPSRPRARSGSPPSAPSGCAGPAGVVPTVDGIDTAARRARRHVRRSASADDAWLDAASRRASSSRPTASRSSPERLAETRRRAPSKRRASSASRSSSSPASRARTRPRPAASRSTSPTRTPSARRRSGSAPPVHRPADGRGRRRAARRRRPGPDVRPARRVRPGRRPRRADRRGGLPDRAAHGRRRGGARLSRRRPACSSRGFRGAPPADAARARRSPPPALAARPTTCPRSPSSTSTR